MDAIKQISAISRCESIIECADMLGDLFRRGGKPDLSQLLESIQDMRNELDTIEAIARELAEAE